jgi:hypothetical protein
VASYRNLRGKGEEDVGKREGVDGRRFSLWRSGERGGIHGDITSEKKRLGLKEGLSSGSPPVSEKKKQRGKGGRGFRGVAGLLLRFVAGLDWVPVTAQVGLLAFSS